MAGFSGWGGLSQILEDDKARRDAEAARVNVWKPPVVKQESASLPVPPLPTVRPMATPVMDLKRQTAEHWDFSPEARKELYSTPVEVKFNEPKRDENGNFNVNLDAGGYYYGPNYSTGNPQIMVHQPWGAEPQKIETDKGFDMWPTYASGILAHEFGHKWDTEHVPDYLRKKWYGNDWTNSPVWTDSFRDRMQKDPMTQDDAHLMAQETYANTVMGSVTPGMEIPNNYRDKYFAGLFNGGAKYFPPAGYNTDYWVHDYGAPQGYYEDGSARGSSMPEPRSWSPPQFPSLSMYGAQG